MIAFLAMLFLAGDNLNEDFYTAIAENDVSAVRRYLQEGQDPNVSEDGIHGPFAFATTIEMIDLLVEFGADIDLPDPQGKTAIRHAIEPDILRHLLKIGAVPDDVKVNDRTLLETLCDKYAQGSDIRTRQMIDILREGGAGYTARCIIALSDLDSFSKLQLKQFDQMTIDDMFIHAVESDRAIIAYLLLESGANPNHKPNLLFHALKRRELTSLLLDRGADFMMQYDASNAGKSGPKLAERFYAIHRASSHSKNLEGLVVLLERGADPNVRDSDGETPLFWAIRESLRNRSESMLPTIYVLLRSGASTSIENNQGETPISLVQSKKVPDSIRSLVTSQHFRSP